MDPDTRIMGNQVRFQTTRWNLVRSARDRSSLNDLIKIYWKPLYFFVRQRGFDNETAKDIVQGFLARLIERQSILKADPSRGRFRTFLLTALSNFIKDWSRTNVRKRSGGGQPMLSLDFSRGESDYAANVSQSETPEIALNRAWARSLWELSLKELRSERPQLEAFKLYLADKDYRTIAGATGMTETAVNSAIRRLKNQLKNIVTAHIRETVSSEEELKAELAEFKSLLSWRARARRPA